jgi:putative hydrolase of the HAD superfamily
MARTMTHRDGRRFDAVVFDLFGTLVSEFPVADWTANFERLGAIFGVEPAAFRGAWERTAIERQTGRLGDIRRNLRENAVLAGADPSDSQLDAAIAVRNDLYAKHFRPMPGALETVAWAREHGYRTALVSMCAPDTPSLWATSPFAALLDAEVFSCESGLRKPDPEIYLAAAAALGAEAVRCVYVGDGSYGELRGASEVGMTAILVRDPDEPVGTMLRPGLEPWSGRTIARIEELPEVVSDLEREERHPTPDTERSGGDDDR